MSSSKYIPRTKWNRDQKAGINNERIKSLNRRTARAALACWPLPYPVPARGSARWKLFRIKRSRSLLSRRCNRRERAAVLIGKTCLSRLYIAPDTSVYCIKLLRLAPRFSIRALRISTTAERSRGFYFYDPRLPPFLPSPSHAFWLSTLLRTLSRLPSRGSVRWHVDIHKSAPPRATPGTSNLPPYFLAIRRS